jgi:hypothetical protein
LSFMVILIIIYPPGVVGLHIYRLSSTVQRTFPRAKMRYT